MLRAALIGSPSSGKTTLFQLMTSARETTRGAHGKGEASIGVSKVPDGRLDRLTAMYNPKKRVPATVEFSDLAIPGGAGGAQALVECGRVLALLRGRFHLSVDDIKELAPAVLRHRIILNFDAHADGKTADSILGAIISGVTTHASAA